MILGYTAYDGNNALFVAAKIYDVTTGNASLVGTFGLTNLLNGSYYYSFNATPGHTYVANVMVYTNSGYSSLNSNYSPEDELFGSVTGIYFTYTAFDAAAGLYPRATIWRHFQQGRRPKVGQCNWCLFW